MTKPIRISLRAGDSVYVNGAILRVDRKTSLEFLNNVTFLLDNHFLKPEEATTPLKKIYLCAQRLLTEPTRGYATRQEFYEIYTHVVASCEDETLSNGLGEVKALINRGRNFEALKALRNLFSLEVEFLSRLEETEPAKMVVNQRK